MTLYFVSGWKSLVCLIYIMLTKNKDKHWVPAASTELESFLLVCAYMKDPTNFKLVKHFFFLLCLKDTNVGYYSCSKLIQRKFVQINFAQKCKLLSPQ